MGRRTRGVRLAPGIWRDTHGCAVIVHVGGRAHETRYPPETPLDQLRLRQAEQATYWRRCALDDAPVAPPGRGTLAGDVARYLETRVGRPSHKADRSHLAAWCLRHGSVSRHKISRHAAEKTIAAWVVAGKAPKTIKHRVRVLRELWRALDGRSARTPVDGAVLPRVPRAAPQPVDEAILVSVAESLRVGLTIRKRHGPSRVVADTHTPVPTATYARFLIRALSGQRPSQIGRAEPQDIDREHRVWWVRPGKGGHPVAFPLTEELDLAWQYFAKVDAWGPFDCRSFALTLRRHGWPAHVRPYALRHTFAIRQLLSGVDLGDLQGLLGHTNPSTTRIYAPVLVARLREAVARRPLKLVSKA